MSMMRDIIDADGSEYMLPILVMTVVCIIGVTFGACVPKQPIETSDIEILESLSVDAVGAASLILILHKEGRPPTDEEAALVEKLLPKDIESFRAVMARIKASEGESLAYKLLEKILLGLM